MYEEKNKMLNRQGPSIESLLSSLKISIQLLIFLNPSKINLRSCCSKFFFLCGFSFTKVHASQDSRGKREATF